MNLSKRTCGCRKWDLTGIPCQHAISAILFDGSVPEDYVHPYYTIETYMKAYEPIIYPVASMEQWRRTSIDPLEPPKDKIQRGRPKIKRKRHPSKPKNPHKLSKAGTIIKCSERKKVGYNSRTCPSKKDKVSFVCSMLCLPSLILDTYILFCVIM